MSARKTGATPRRTALSTRLSLRLALVALLFMVVQVASVIWMYASNPNALDELLLSAESDRVSDAMVATPQGPRLVAPPALSEPFSPNTRFAFVVRDTEGRLIASQDTGDLKIADEAPWSVPVVRTQREERGDHFLLTGMRREEVGDEAVWVNLAIAGQGFSPFIPVILNELQLHALLPLGLLSVLFLLFNVSAMLSSFRPLNRVIEQVNGIDPSEVGVRISGDESPVLEVHALVTSVNRMLERIELSVQALQDFAGDAAHELRTPLAVMLLNIEKLPPGPLRESLMSDVVAMRRLVDQMLDMSHANALDIQAGAEADLVGVGREAVIELAPLAYVRGRKITFQDLSRGRDLTIRGHAEALGRALRNLVENALSHTPEGSEVVVACGPGRCLSVRDHGPGIPEEMRGAVLRRHCRLHPEEGGGAGLGLAIADTIVRAHRGRIEIAEAPGGGALVCLMLDREGGESGSSPPRLTATRA